MNGTSTVLFQSRAYIFAKNDCGHNLEMIKLRKHEEEINQVHVTNSTSKRLADCELNYVKLFILHTSQNLNSKKKKNLQLRNSRKTRHHPVGTLHMER